LLVLSVALGLLIVTSGCLGGLGGGGADGATEPSATTPGPTTDAVTATRTPANGSTNGTATPTASSTGSVSASPSASPTPTPTSGPEYDLNESVLERAVRERVDARRAESGYDGLIRTRTGDLSEMARTYSSELAEVGYLTHDAGGETPRDRYERYGFLDRCRITNNADRGVVATSELEVLGAVSLGRNQTIDGTTYVATNATEAAEVLIAQWYDDAESRRALMLADARHLGFGITVEEETVYAVGYVC
jgi:uncharacterized protein YkwD